MTGEFLRPIARRPAVQHARQGAEKNTIDRKNERSVSFDTCPAEVAVSVAPGQITRKVEVAGEALAIACVVV